MDLKLLNEMIDKGYVMRQTHDKYPLSIYNYSKTAAYEKIWNEITLTCRGLILNNETGEIVARPFRKFFNLGELNTPLPNEPFDVLEKMDGSLGILYWYNDVAYISTRGSFNSEQAIVATDILNTKYKHVLSEVNRDYTYLFEILYPENRIVVDYGGQRDIILIGVIDKKTGKDIPIPYIGFSVVPQHVVQSLEALQANERDNHEGYVIRYKGGFRVKVKHDEYCRLHRIVTGVSNKTVWEYLREGRPFDDLIDRVPDEFYDWLTATKQELQRKFNEIEKIHKIIFGLFSDIDDRKTLAGFFIKAPYSSILFCMLDNKSYDDIIWKLVRPKFEKPFSNQSEENVNE